MSRAHHNGRHHTALALALVMAAVTLFAHFDPIGSMSPLRRGDLAGCDGVTVRLDGLEAELLRLHNEARTEHGLPEFCVRASLMAAAGSF